MPCCYIHIGPHKTGSSSLKHFVRANEDRFDALGLFFPKLVGADGKRARNHEELAFCREIDANGDMAPDATLWPEVEAVVRAGEKDVLLSSEMFWQWLEQDDNLTRMFAFFHVRDYRIVVIAYVRDQPAWMNSRYVQAQKRLSGIQSFEDYWPNAVANGRAEPARFLAPYFDDPRCEVDVVSFEEAARSGLELDFIRRCGVSEVSGLEIAPPRNINPGAKTIYAAQEIMRRLDAVHGLKMIPGYPQIYNPFQKKCRRLGWDDAPYIALDQATYDRIRAMFAESNEAFAQRHFGKSWTELAPPRSFTPSAFDPRTADRHEAAEVEGVVADVTEKFADALRRFGGPRASKTERNAALAGANP